MRSLSQVADGESTADFRTGKRLRGEKRFRVRGFNLATVSFLFDTIGEETPEVNAVFFWIAHSETD